MEQIQKYLTQLGHKVYIKDNKLYDSTGKQVYKDNNKYYVKSNQGNRLYFQANGKFQQVNSSKEEKGFWKSIGDSVKSFASKMGEVNPQGTKAFIPSGSQKIVELSQVANNIPVKTSNNSYRTYSKDDQNKAKKQLGILGAGAIASPAIAQTVITSTPYVLQGLKVAGQAMTPSTWIGGGMQAAGYTAPNWLLTGADLAASAYFANEAGKEIDKNGLNWRTGFNALMALSPMTRETEAIESVANTLRRPTQAISSVVDDFRAARNAVSSPEAVLARELNQSVKNTRLINVPVEHVSPNGMTKGSTFDIGERNISYTITEPSFEFQLNKNSQSKQINWEDLPTNTPKGLIMPDGTLVPIDRYDGDLQLENYLGNPIGTEMRTVDEYPEFRMGIFNQNGREYQMGYNRVGDILVETPESLDILLAEDWKGYDSYSEAVNTILNSRHNFIESLPDNEIKDIVRHSQLGKEVDLDKSNLTELKVPNTRIGDIFKSKINNDINDVYLSDEYITRYLESLGVNPNNQSFRESVRDRIANDLNSTYDKAIPIFYRTDSRTGGVSNSVKNLTGEPTEFRFGLNGNTTRDYLENDWTSILFHEFGHNIYKDTTPFSKYIIGHNNELFNIYGTPKRNFSSKGQFEWANGVTDYMEYISNTNEFRQRIMEGVRYGIKEGLTPEEIYNKCNILGFAKLKHYFKKEYIIKMLGLMLGTAPLVINSKKNDKSS